MYDGNVVNNEGEICNIFNWYFIAVGCSLAEEINDNNLDLLSYLGDRCKNYLFFKQTESSEINKLISSKIK